MVMLYFIYLQLIMEAVAKHDFVATANDELSFTRGSKLKVRKTRKYHIIDNVKHINIYMYVNL